MGIGFELWTMNNGIQFDNIYVGRDVKDALRWADKTYGLKKEVEKEHVKEQAKAEKQAKKTEAKEGGLISQTVFFFSNLVEEYPIPLFFTIVAVLVGFVVLLECRRPARKLPKVEEPKEEEPKEEEEKKVEEVQPKSPVKPVEKEE